MKTFAWAAAFLWVIIVLLSTSNGAAQNKLVGIAPLEEDLKAMRHTLRRLEVALNTRNPQESALLISPRLHEAQRKIVAQKLSDVIGAMPPEARYRLRTDIGMGAIVPLGADLVRVQFNGTVMYEGEKHSGPVHIELEAVEMNQRRRWLVRDANFVNWPTTRGKRRWYYLVIALASGAIIALSVHIKRRRRRL